MTNITYTCKEEEYLLRMIFDNIFDFVFGDLDQIKDEFIKHFFSCLENLTFVNNDVQLGKDDNSGFIRLKKTGKEFDIYLKGFTNCLEEDRLYILQEVVHELFHGFANALFHFDKNSVSKYLEDASFFKSSYMGSIFTMTKSTNEVSKYGVAFAEACTDIYTQMFLVYYFNNLFNQNNVKIDSILQNKDCLGLYKSKYFYFEPITKLMIQACENSPEVDYDDLIENDKSIFNYFSPNNASFERKNIFLYSMLFDPFYIESEFDYYMGKDKYREMCLFLDKVFEGCISENIYDDYSNNKLLEFCNYIKVFFNRRLERIKANSLWDEEKCDIVEERFNSLFNQCVRYYSTYNKATDAYYMPIQRYN